MPVSLKNLTKSFWTRFQTRSHLGEAKAYAKHTGVSTSINKLNQAKASFTRLSNSMNVEIYLRALTTLKKEIDRLAADGEIKGEVDVQVVSELQKWKRELVDRLAIMNKAYGAARGELEAAKPEEIKEFFRGIIV